VSRISQTFTDLRARRVTGLVAFVTAGDPDLETTGEIVRAIDRAGADVIELGVPFSDPVADGPVIQRASERALAGGVTLGRVLSLVSLIRSGVRAPIVLFTYVNPVLRMGIDAFARRAAAVGIDGVLLVDVPVEEAQPYERALASAGIDPIHLVGPTSSDARMAAVARGGRGFLYAISRLGVTGAREAVADGAAAVVTRLRRHTDLPIALGFGLSRPEHIAAAGEHADAAVVGSALVQTIADAAAADANPAHVAATFVSWLRGEAHP